MVDDICRAAGKQVSEDGSRHVPTVRQPETMFAARRHHEL